MPSKKTQTQKWDVNYNSNMLPDLEPEERIEHLLKLIGYNQRDLCKELSYYYPVGMRVKDIDDDNIYTINTVWYQELDSPVPKAGAVTPTTDPDNPKKIIVITAHDINNNTFVPVSVEETGNQ